VSKKPRCGSVGLFVFEGGKQQSVEIWLVPLSWPVRLASGFGTVFVQRARVHQCVYLLSAEVHVLEDILPILGNGMAVVEFPLTDLLRVHVEVESMEGKSAGSRDAKEAQDDVSR
jgi:hypothetical protein